MKKLWQHALPLVQAAALSAVTWAGGMQATQAGTVQPSDTVLVPTPVNGPIIAPIAGYNWETRSDHATEVPLYKNVNRDSDDYWNAMIDEMLQARVHAVLWHGRHCDSLTSGTSGRGNMCPRHLTKYVTAAKRAGAENILKAGYFDDTGNYPNAANVSRFDLSDRSKWKYFWDHRMKIWFDTVPKNMWYLLDGKPVVVFWNLSDSNFSNQQGNASALLTWLKNNFKTRYGMDPAFILQDDWFTNDTTINSSHAYGKHSWFSARANEMYTYTMYNGAKWGAMAPGYSKTDRTVSRRNGATLEEGLAAGRDAKFTFLESWTNWGENAGFYRSTAWSYPNQYINIVRKYADPAPQTIRFQAEGADRFFDSSVANQGGEYADRALDVGRLADGSGWYVGWITAGEWLEYQDVQLGSGNHRFTARVATSAAGKKMHMVIDGLALPAVEVPNTGGLGNYQLVHLGETVLKAGAHDLRLVFDTSDGMNVDWFFVKRGASSGGGGTPTPTGPAGYTWCANEGGTCNLSGTNDVAYGGSGKFFYKYNVSGAITINNATFGDPIPGAAKAGFYKPSASTGIDTSAYYNIISRYSGKLVDVAGVSVDNDANIHQWQSTGAANQQWKFESAGNGWYLIKARHSGKCVDVSGTPTVEGANIHQWTCHGGDNQQWKLQDAGGGYYYLVSRASGKVMDVTGPSTNNGDNIHQWSLHGGQNQQWRLQKVN